MTADLFRPLEPTPPVPIHPREWRRMVDEQGPRTGLCVDGPAQGQAVTSNNRLGWITYAPTPAALLALLCPDPPPFGLVMTQEVHYRPDTIDFDDRDLNLWTLRHPADRPNTSDLVQALRRYTDQHGTFPHVCTV